MIVSSIHTCDAYDACAFYIYIYIYELLELIRKIQ